jgi:phage shock protein A
MQTEQVRERFSRIEQYVDNAAKACQTSGAVPDQLRECLNELEQQSDQAKQAAQQDQSDEKLRQCVDNLEEVGDRAMRACKDAGNVDQEIQNALRQAHDAISDLKQQLH